MADILSQDEIDQLLSAISSGEEAAALQMQKKVKIYDLKRPDLVRGKTEQELAAVFTAFSTSVQAYLACELVVPCHVNVVSIDTLLFEEFFRATAILSPRARIDWNGTDVHPIVMQLDPAPAEAILVQLTGGTDIARGAEISATERTFTAFESRILQHTFRNFAKHMQRGFSQMNLQIQMELESLAFTTPAALAAHAEEVAVIIAAEMKIGSVEGMLNIALPRKVMRFLWPLVEVEQQRREPQKKEASVPVIFESKIEGITYGKLKNLKSGAWLSLKPGSERRKYGVV